jgi:hypothetical protein
MSGVATAIAGSALLGAYGSHQAGKAGRAAGDAQTAAAMAGIEEQRRQFDAIQQLLSPFVRGGTSAFGQQLDLMGINGADPQRAALEALQQSPQFTESLRLGESAILQNASATGGLRGGNTQGALMTFRPSLLASTINDQMTRLGGLAAVGQNAAAGVGNAGMQTGNAVSGLLQQAGAAQAGSILARGNAQAGAVNSLAGGLGMFAGLGGFAGMSNPQQLIRAGGVTQPVF